jgi:hypothetical protein
MRLSIILRIHCPCSTPLYWVFILHAINEGAWFLFVIGVFIFGEDMAGSCSLPSERYVVLVSAEPLWLMPAVA